MDSEGVIRLSKDQIEQLQEKLKPLVPHSLTVLGVCTSILGGVVDREVMVDKWPDFTVLVDRSTPGHSVPGMKRLVNEISQCIFTTSSDEKLMEEFFLRPGVLNWHLPEVVIPGSQLNIRGAIKRAAEKKGRKVSVKINLLIYFLSSKDPLPQFEMPPGYTLGSVRLDEETTVASEWPFSDGEKDAYVHFVLKNFPSVAVREAKTGALIGYYLQHWLQALGFLFVKEEHRGKGLGKFLVVEKARQCFHNGDPVVFIHVVSDNEASCALHEKCGFTNGGAVEWLAIEAADK